MNPKTKNKSQFFSHQTETSSGEVRPLPTLNGKAEEASWCSSPKAVLHKTLHTAWQSEKNLSGENILLIALRLGFH